MTLSLSSVLHYWSSRYDSIPVVGGKPVHSRNSAATWIDQRGIVQSAIVNTPRFEWADLGDGAGRRKVMRLEQARTNVLQSSSDASTGSWAKTFMTVTTGVADPTGGTGACTLTATGADGNVTQNQGAGSSLARTTSAWLRRRTGVGNVSILDPNDDNWHVRTVPADGSWIRVTFPYTAATGRWMGVRLSTSGDAVDMWGAQIDDGNVSATIPTAGVAATRSADSFYWDYTPPPQALFAYVRFVERGTIAAGSGSIVFYISDSIGNDARFYIDVGGGFYEVAHRNGTSVTSIVAVAPAYGDIVELVATLVSTGNVRLSQSINGAAVTAGATSGVRSLAATWSAPALRLNSLVANSPGLSDFAELKIVKFADVVASTDQGIMDELRAFELGANGDVL